MPKTKLLNYIDYLPLAVFIAYLIHFSYTCTTSEYVLVWQHYVAIFLFVINIYLFYKNHKAAVVFLGFIIILGICKVVACKQGIETSSFGFSSEMNIPIGQTFFWFWLIIHFAVSFRHYYGIATKAYWNELLKLSK